MTIWNHYGIVGFEKFEKRNREQSSHLEISPIAPLPSTLELVMFCLGYRKGEKLGEEV